MREFLKADKPDDLEEEIYQRCRFYADYLNKSIAIGNSFLYSTYEYASYVYRHRICGDDFNFNLQKTK